MTPILIQDLNSHPEILPNISKSFEDDQKQSDSARKAGTRSLVEYVVLKATAGEAVKTSQWLVVVQNVYKIRQEASLHMPGFQKGIRIYSLVERS
jgi:hypothetical protein